MSYMWHMGKFLTSRVHLLCFQSVSVPCSQRVKDGQTFVEYHEEDVNDRLFRIILQKAHSMFKVCCKIVENAWILLCEFCGLRSTLILQRWVVYKCVTNSIKIIFSVYPRQVIIYLNLKVVYWCQYFWWLYTWGHRWRYAIQSISCNIPVIQPWPFQLSYDFWIVVHGQSAEAILVPGGQPLFRVGVLRKKFLLFCASWLWMALHLQTYQTWSLLFKRKNNNSIYLKMWLGINCLSQIVQSYLVVVPGLYFHSIFIWFLKARHICGHTEIHLTSFFTFRELFLEMLCWIVLFSFSCSMAPSEVWWSEVMLTAWDTG